MDHSTPHPQRILLVLTIVGALIVTVGRVVPATATTQSESASVPLTNTDFATTVDIAEFDQSQGRLTQVVIQLAATVQGTIQVENLSSSSQSMGDATLSAEMILTSVARPALALTPALPADTQTFSLPIYDGTTDYSGASGVTFGGLQGTDTVTATLTDPADLAVFIGNGTTQFDLDATARSLSNATGGNLELVFTTLAAAQVDVTYQFEVPNIDIEKTPDLQTVTVGDDATFTIDVTNTGEADLVNVEVTDPVTPSCDRVIGPLAVGATETYTCVFTGATSDFTNVATVTGEDVIGIVVTDNDDAQVVVVEPAAPTIEIEKTPDLQTVVTGTDVTFTIDVTNNGPVDLVNVVVTDPITPSCDRDIGALAVGAVVTYTCVFPNVTGPFTNVATVTGEDARGTVVTDQDDAAVVVEEVLALPLIDIEKTPDDQTVTFGGDALFTITVTNTSTIELLDVTVTDPLAPSCDRFIGQMAAGAVVSYSCIAPAVTASFTNLARVTGRDGPGNVVTDSDDAIVRVTEPPKKVPPAKDAPKVPPAKPQPVAAPTQPTLAFTGRETTVLALAGAVLLLLGSILVGYERRRGLVTPCDTESS